MNISRTIGDTVAKTEAVYASERVSQCFDGERVLQLLATGPIVPGRDKVSIFDRIFFYLRS